MNEETCKELLASVRAGETDPASGDAQRLLMVGLMRGWISRKEADEAADIYWEQRVKAVLKQVAAGDVDPKHPEIEFLLDWGVRTKRITRKQRAQACRAFADKREPR